jgi:hypothetical protein
MPLVLDGSSVLAATQIRRNEGAFVVVLDSIGNVLLDVRRIAFSDADLTQYA